MRDEVKESENTVAADGQTRRSGTVSYLGSESAPLRVLVLGNSITRHEPKSEIGWNHDHGMAASAPEKDFVHLLYGKLKAKYGDVFVRIRQAAEWERSMLESDRLRPFADDKAFDADVLVFRLGENVPSGHARYFGEAITELVDYLCPAPKRVIFTNCFWANAEKDEAIASAAAKRGETAVNITCVDRSQTAAGLFEHSGVAAHPGDLGMETIAEKIFKAF